MTATAAGDTPMQRLISDGGLSILIPDGWQEVHSADHLSVFVAEDGDARGAADFRPTCVVHEVPDHVSAADWWEGLIEVADGPLLLEVADHDTGFAVIFAQVVDGTSVLGTGHGYRLPGRTLLVTVQFPASSAAELLPVAMDIGVSVEIEGVA